MELHQGRFKLDNRKKICNMRVVKHRNKLPSKAVLAP